MRELEFLQGVDIYLLDQLVKHNIHSKQRILDAGCGNGRNLFILMQQAFDFVAIDPNKDCIERLQNEFPTHSKQFVASGIEDFTDPDGFDAIVCNAVLHFAKDHEHFDGMMHKLSSLLLPGGVLFIRMTSNIGIESKLHSGNNGVFDLPDHTRRYLLSREKINQICIEHSLGFVEPVKTVNVDDKRCMTTLVLQGS